MAGIDYMTSYSEWLAIQTGVPPFRTWTADPQNRYIHDGRSLAEWVHYDFLYQAYHNAALILLDQTPDTVLNTNPYLNPANPYKSAKVETGFATFGAPHICCILGTVPRRLCTPRGFRSGWCTGVCGPKSSAAGFIRPKRARLNIPSTPTC